MPTEGAARIVAELTSRGYNVERRALTLLASAEDTDRAMRRAIEVAPADALKITPDHVRTALTEMDGTENTARVVTPTGATHAESDAAPDLGAGAPGAPGADPPISGGTHLTNMDDGGGVAAVEPKGVLPESGDGDGDGEGDGDDGVSRRAEAPDTAAGPPGGGGDESGSVGQRSPEPVDVSNDVTDQSTGTGEYRDFVRVFRDRYEQLATQLRSRVTARPAESIQEMAGGSEAGMIGMVEDIRSTAGGHWLVELEDTTGTFPCLIMQDREIATEVDHLLLDEVIAVEGTLSGDTEILFVDAVHFPDVPRNFRPATADRSVRAALVSDIHVGSQEFRADAWQRFADWLHRPAAETVEYLLIAGDMVEGVGVYPDQDDELSILDIYDQYERFAELLKEVPGDLEIVMIPGNHDAVRLAEPQPGFDDDLRAIMRAHDARIAGNPSLVTVAGVDVLMYHGMSLDEVIAEFPEDVASYDNPHRAMNALLRKRHLAPKYGGKLRLAPEAKDYLVIEEVPDVFHAGHLHKLGVGSYRNVRTINSACWQAQTAFQRRNNIDPDVGFAPILDLETLDVTVQKFT